MVSGSNCQSITDSLGPLVHGWLGAGVPFLPFPAGIGGSFQRPGGKGTVPLFRRSGWVSPGLLSEYATVPPRQQQIFCPIPPCDLCHSNGCAGGLDKICPIPCHIYPCPRVRSIQNVLCPFSVCGSAMLWVLQVKTRRESGGSLPAIQNLVERRGEHGVTTGTLYGLCRDRMPWLAGAFVFQGTHSPFVNRERGCRTQLRECGRTRVGQGPRSGAVSQI